MRQITVHEVHSEAAKLEQLPLKRDWMDETFDRHAYQCFPMSLSNRLGWGISFPEDITFIWDGINDSTPDHVKVLSGEKYTHPGRGNKTISFNTGLTFVSESNISLLTFPVPNQFIRGSQCITTIISTSVLPGELPIAWMITEPNIEITIPANTPIAAILPISIKGFEEYEMFITSKPVYRDPGFNEWQQGRNKVSMSKNSMGEWTHFYRDAVDHLGNAFGEHETKKIILKTTSKDDNAKN